MSAAHFDQYLVNQVNSASPEQLMILLYNGAIRFLSEAECAMQEGNVARQGMLIGRTIDIINELSATLDHEIGGAIAANLDVLYSHMNRELLQSNIHDDVKRLGRVKNMLIDLRDTWLQAIEINHATAVTSGQGTSKSAGRADVHLHSQAGGY